MKKRITAIVACAVLSLGILAGCGAQESEPVYDDAGFLRSLAMGLEDRWELNDKYAKEHPGEYETAESMKSYVQAELDAVGKYENGTFEDATLHELAISYINILNESLEAADSYNVNNYNSLVEWDNIYKERTIILKNIFEKYDVPISSEYQDSRDSILSAGKAAQKDADVENALQSIADSADFTFKAQYGSVTGTTKVTNATGMSFKNVQFDVMLYDGDNVRIDTAAVWVENWNDGETVILEAYSSQGDLPATYKVVPSYWEVA